MLPWRFMGSRSLPRTAAHHRAHPRAPEDHRERDRQCVREADEHARHVRSATFDALDVREIEVDELGELLLRPASALSQTADVRGDGRQHIGHPVPRHRRREADAELENNGR